MLKVLRNVCVSLLSRRRDMFSVVQTPEVMIAVSYLDIKVLVDFDDVAKEENVLHQTGELPHIAQVLKCLRGLGGHFWLGRDIELGLCGRALEARHCESESCVSRTIKCMGGGGDVDA